MSNKLGKIMQEMYVNVQFEDFSGDEEEKQDQKNKKLK